MKRSGVVGEVDEEKRPMKWIWCSLPSESTIGAVKFGNELIYSSCLRLKMSFEQARLAIHNEYIPVKSTCPLLFGLVHPLQGYAKAAIR